MPEKPPSDQLFDLGAELLRQTLQNTFEFGAAALSVSSKFQEAALTAASEISTAAINATSTLFPPRDRIHLEDTPVGVLHLDDGLRVVLSNPAARALLGRSIAFGEALDQVLPFKGAALREQIDAGIADGGSFATTVEVQQQDSGAALPIPVRVHIEALPHSPGQRPGLMAVLTRLPLENLRLVSETRTRLLEICAREQSPEAVLRGALEELYAVVPYEIATYYEYSEGGDDAAACDPQSSGHIRRIRFTLDRERPGFAWPMRWMSVPKAIDQWTRSPQPLIDDIEEFIAGLSETSAEHLKRHISTQAATSENLRSFLYFPYWRGARIVSALSFASRSSRKFTPLHQEALSAIGLPQVLELIGAAYDRSSEKFYRGIANLFQSGAVPGQLASDFVREIAGEYRWDYVGIFRVARVSGHFRVVAQQDNTGELTIDRDYLQPIDRGVLGTVLREQRPIRISDVDTEGRKFDYIKLGENHKSCLCFPISVGGNVEWILDCESTQQAAFAKPDQDALAGLIKSLQSTLGLWFEMQLNEALLEQIRQGVVVAGANGAIERMNAKARQLFGMRDVQAQGQKLENYAADAVSRDIFSKTQAVDNRRLKILGADNIERGVLASSILSGEAFNRWIWLFTDTAEREWISNLRYARATVEQVASQAHGPLILASALIKRLAATIAEPGMHGEQGRRVLLRILKTLSKADLTYERLAQALALREQIDVSRLLDRFVDKLPKEQRAALQLHSPPGRAEVRCASDTLCRALASIFDHLYKLRIPNTPITCRVEEEAKHVAIHFDAKLTTSADTAQHAVSDKLTQVEAAARFAAALPRLAQKMSSDRPSIEHARWDLLDEGGELIEAALADGSHRMQIRLIKAIVPEQVSL